jgi:hypothetical protein
VNRARAAFPGWAVASTAQPTTARRARQSIYRSGELTTGGKPCRPATDVRHSSAR